MGPDAPVGPGPAGAGMRAAAQGRPTRAGGPTPGRRVPDAVPRGRDVGAATVPVAIGLLALLTLVAVGVQFGAVVVGRHRAESAADLGALAGAALVLQGQAAGCGRAAEVVRANGASVLSCRWEGWEILVETTVRAGPLGIRAGGRARAGPDLEALVPAP